MIGRHPKADPVTHEPSRLVCHPDHPVDLIGTERFLGRAQEKQGHQPFGNRNVRPLHDRANGHRELLAAGAAKIDALANAALACALGLQFGNPFVTNVLAVRTYWTFGPAPRFQKFPGLAFIGIGLHQFR